MQQTISVRGIVVCTPLYLPSCSLCMCVHAVSTSLYKNMQLILPIGCRRAAFPIALLGATELSLSATRSVKPGESSEGQYLLINPICVELH